MSVGRMSGKDYIVLRRKTHHLRQKLLVIKHTLEDMPLRLTNERIALEMKYGAIASQLERFTQILLLIEQGTMPIEVTKQASTTIKSCTEQLTTTIPTFDESNWLSFLPDLVLIKIMEHCDTEVDIRAFVWALPRPLTIEHDAYRQLGRCLSRRLRLNFLTVCKGEKFCRNPCVCLRCFLLAKGRCTKCKNGVDLPFDSPYSISGCNSTITADTKTEGPCDQVQHCPKCKSTYIATEEAEFIRTVDFSCACFFVNRRGCVKCTRECTRCANIGCMNDAHYKINPWDGNKEEFPLCDDCYYPHCCKSKVRQRGEESGEIKEVWDHFVCPSLPPIDGDMDNYRCSLATKVKQRVLRPTKKRLSAFFAA